MHEGGCPGASSLVDRVVFETWGGPFFDVFLGTLIFNILAGFGPQGYPKGVVLGGHLGAFLGIGPTCENRCFP